jgi:hypothetical protein
VPGNPGVAIGGGMAQEWRSNDSYYRDRMIK